MKELLENAFPLVLQAAQKLADSAVDGANLGKDQKQALYAGYVIINTHFDDLVESTANEYDDQLLDALSAFCADTLEEAGISVPVIPEELES